MARNFHGDKWGPMGSVIAALCCLGVAPLLAALTAIGLGFLIHDLILIPLLALFLGISLWALHCDRPRHGSWQPVALAAAAAVPTLGGLFVSPLIVAAGLTLLVAASVWNWVLIRGLTDGRNDEIKSENLSKHVLIIGAGSGAFGEAIRAAELGARVTVVERGGIGGTCVNVGCVPSKTLIKAAETFHSRRHQPFAGIPDADGFIDLQALMAQKRHLVEQLREEKYRKVLAAYPSVEYLEGEAEFVDTETVRVRLRKGGRREIRLDRTVIATGASPWAPPIPGLEETPYWTNVEALEAEELPERLIVVGGSAVGAELAQLFSRLGSRVTVVEVLPTLVPNEDEEVGAALGRYFKQEGIQVLTGARIDSVSYGEGGGYRPELEADGEEVTLTADRASARISPQRAYTRPAADRGPATP